MPDQTPKAAIVGLAGTDLSPAERALFAAHPPAGIILFARNIGAPAQLARLNATLRAVLPPHAALMIDQEGGRVARLRPPHWRAHPAAAAIGALHATKPPAGLRAAWLTGALIGTDCAAAGFTIANAPVLDLQIEGAHSVIGDRAFAADPATVAALGRAMAEGLRAAGIQPVAKHIPGHGRATTDSHLELPRLAQGTEADLAPFKSNADIGWAMTAHILYEGWDPTHPATLSEPIITRIIRGTCRFQGVLVSDDLTMQALSGPPATLARQALAAGCDLVLHCSGDLAAMQSLLEDCPALTPQAEARLAAARAQVAAARLPLHPPTLAVERDALLAPHA